MKFIIKFYQKYISHFLGPSCRFQPTCSEYALESLERHGYLKGFTLFIIRFLKCNPFFKSGYDPVPKSYRIFQPSKK